MDNILIQVTGRKRVVLFSPDDVDKLYLKGVFCVSPLDLLIYNNKLSLIIQPLNH